jgi:ribonuclease P protein component
VCGIVSEGGSVTAPPLLLSPFRLPTNAFATLFEAKASSEVGRSLVMRYVPNGLDKTRVGVVTSKKTFHRAVERTRARRLMREAFRLERTQLKPGYDLVLIGRRALVGAQCQAVREDLLKLCRRARLLANSKVTSKGERA